MTGGWPCMVFHQVAPKPVSSATLTTTRLVPWPRWLCLGEQLQCHWVWILAVATAAIRFYNSYAKIPFQNFLNWTFPSFPDQVSFSTFMFSPSILQVDSTSVQNLVLKNAHRVIWKQNCKQCTLQNAKLKSVANKTIQWEPQKLILKLCKKTKLSRCRPTNSNKFITCWGWKLFNLR